MKKNILFVCSRNQWRSPTAQKMYQNDERINVRSGGTSPRAIHTVNIKDITWADTIFVMEYKHKERLKANFSKHLTYKKVIVLEIPDEYKFMDEELIELLESSIEVYLK